MEGVVSVGSSPEALCAVFLKGLDHMPPALQPLPAHPTLRPLCSGRSLLLCNRPLLTQLRFSCSSPHRPQRPQPAQYSTLHFPEHTEPNQGLVPDSLPPQDLPRGPAGPLPWLSWGPFQTWAHCCPRRRLT